MRFVIRMIAGLTVACLGSTTVIAQVESQPSAITYAVAVDSAVERLDVRVEFADAPQRLALGSSRAARYLRQLRRCDSNESLRLRRGRLTSVESCIEYQVQLRKLANSRTNLRRYSEVLDQMMAPDDWMLLPNDDQQLLKVAFELPEGVNVSVPWQPVDTSVRTPSYQFRHRELSSDAISVFGRFAKHRVSVPGGELRVALLTTRHKPAAAKMLSWLHDAATNVSLAHGNFPLKSTQILVIPVNDRASEPVPFGRVIRNGGEAVQFFVDTDWTEEAFIGDWTATHEFSHLLLPYVEDRWISEGFASYFQNVLMARGGEYSERKAWQKLYEGFQRGRASAPGMSPRSATMRNGGLMKMYWSGAAVAFMADVKLREASEGKVGLDSVLRKLRFCCLPSHKVYSDRELFTHMDTLTDYPVFVELFEEYANTGTFPDVTKTFDALGIRVRGGRVLLTDVPGKSIRRAIMGVNQVGSSGRISSAP